MFLRPIKKQGIEDEQRNRQHKKYRYDRQKFSAGINIFVLALPEEERKDDNVVLDSRGELE